jgi:hypothetical protein
LEIGLPDLKTHIKVTNRKRFNFAEIFEGYYLLLFLLAILVTRILIHYLWTTEEVVSAEIPKTFVIGFIEWTGVLYGILLPLILIKVWEEFDEIDREFDREVDSVRGLYENLLLFYEEGESIKEQALRLLRDYVRHVEKKYKYELLENDFEKSVGDQVLTKIRIQLVALSSREEKNSEHHNSLVSELFRNLSNVIDNRGNRVWLINQRVFEKIRPIAIIVTIIFIVPFYVIAFTNQTSLLDNVLIFGITFVTIFIYLSIEDLNKPFKGSYKIDKNPWRSLRKYLVIGERQNRLEKFNKSHLEKQDNQRAQGTSP